jgi:hypothetical protein
MNKKHQKIPFIVIFIQAVVAFKRLAKKYRDRFGYRKGQKLSRKKGNSLQKAIQASQNIVQNAQFGKGIMTLYIDESEGDKIEKLIPNQYIKRKKKKVVLYGQGNIMVRAERHLEDVDRGRKPNMLHTLKSTLVEAKATNEIAPVAPLVPDNSTMEMTVNTRYLSNISHISKYSPIYLSIYLILHLLLLVFKVVVIYNQLQINSRTYPIYFKRTICNKKNLIKT